MKDRELPKLDLNVTNRCNFRCVHCAFDSGVTSMPELSVGEIEQILKDTKELGGKRIDITGGEPLLRDDVEEIIRIGKGLGYKIELVTNGSLLTEEKLQRLKILGLDGIAISLDGSTADIYNRIRRTDEATFEMVVSNIRKSKEAGFYTKVNTVVFKCNLDDVCNITELAITLGADEHGLYYFTPIGRGKCSADWSVDPLEWIRYTKEKLKKYNGIRISAEFPLMEKVENDYDCIIDKEKSHLQILPDGNVYPCAIMASYIKPVANLHNCSVKDVWGNDRLWKEYSCDACKRFKDSDGHCVDFRKAFNVKGYDRKKYSPICPMRKFDL